LKLTLTQKSLNAYIVMGHTVAQWLRHRATNRKVVRLIPDGVIEKPCHVHVPTVLKSGSLKFLEPSGPVKACNGIALPLPYIVMTPTVFGSLMESLSSAELKCIP
jgi:hypothetical protein